MRERKTEQIEESGTHGLSFTEDMQINARDGYMHDMCPNKIKLKLQAKR